MNMKLLGWLLLFLFVCCTIACLFGGVWLSDDLMIIAMGTVDAALIATLIIS